MSDVKMRNKDISKPEDKALELKNTKKEIIEKILRDTWEVSIIKSIDD